MKWRLGLTMCLLPLLAVAAARDDFARQWPLTLSREDGGAYRVVLDEAVYRQVQDPGLRDLVVLNAEGATVPTSVFAADAPLARAPRQLTVPWFALPAAPAGAANGWELVSQADADGRLRRVEVRANAAGAAALPRTALLVDLSHVREAIAALQLQWQPVESLDLGYRVEASDDLEHWLPLATRGRMVDLHRDQLHLLQRRLELFGLMPQYQRARYLRLTPDRDDVPLVVTAITVEPAARAVVAPQWLELAPPAAVDGQAYTFDTAGQFPVEQVDVALPGNNAVEWRLDSRASADAAWVPRAGPWVGFQVDAAGVPSRSAARALAGPVRDRYWRLRANVALGETPTLRLGYRPEVAVFLSQGAAPYVLAAGSARARRPQSPLPQMVAELRRQRGQDWQPSSAYLGTARDLAGDAALRPQRDWKAWLLWGVLGLGALVVAVFAVSLLRAPRPATPEPADAADPPV